MNEFLGAGNTIGSYLLVLVVYGGLFIAMRFGHPAVEPEFRKTFYNLWIVSGFVGLIANYLLYLAGVMSFLPWLNNFIHVFIWIGGCLMFLYSGAYKRPLWEQFVLFFIYSFVVKLAERQILGTWEHPNWLGIPGNLTYMLGWSLADGLIIPFGCWWGLKIASSFIKGLVVPNPKLM